jgi:hypothetical protein
MGSKTMKKMQKVVQDPFPVYAISSFLPLDHYQRLKHQVLNELAYFPKSTE